MYYISDFRYQPPCYGAPPPGNFLFTLEGNWMYLMRIEKVEDTSPQRYKVYTSHRYLEEINAYSLFKFRLKLQIRIDGSGYSGNHERDSVRVLSCSNCNNDNKDEDICIELEHKERKDNRLTDEELAYIRKLDEK